MEADRDRTGRWVCRAVRWAVRWRMPDSSVGDSIRYVLIGADIRPHCVDALQKLVGKIKNDLVVEREIYA